MRASSAGTRKTSGRFGLQSGLDRSEWMTVAGMGAVVLGLHAVGFFLLFAFVVPHHFDLGNAGVFGVGLGLTAYTLGLRHAFDADHIGAIDNTTRKLMADGQRPLSVGFFFSLGHSTIVFALAIGFTLGIRGLSGAVTDDGSWLHSATGLVGPTISGTFLWIIGLLNLLVLIGIVGVFRRMRSGEYDEAELDAQLNNRGFMNRFYKRATNAVRRPWQMYPVGLLFGLGFDTATEIALLATAGAAAAGGLPIYAILCLPVLFAAGMSLLDSIDGAFMNFAYGWAFSKPVRKIFYNITITGLSVVVALVIGTIELMSVVADKLSLAGAPWDFVSGLDLNYVGYAIVALFALTWILALTIWRVGRIEERWSAALAVPDPAESNPER
ncbi:MAG: nickel/cobalt transporter (NiCoT) family protein [Solirubrobacteraceae bacterium]|nr:nickel/cobalt transporter (NiCoT) family protein [Solirubrobacteraceae bacterium]